MPLPHAIRSVCVLLVLPVGLFISFLCKDCAPMQKCLCQNPLALVIGSYLHLRRCLSRFARATTHRPLLQREDGPLRPLRPFCFFSLELVGLKGIESKGAGRDITARHHSEASPRHRAIELAHNGKQCRQEEQVNRRQVTGCEDARIRGC
jgi:hypothetical protein